MPMGIAPMAMMKMAHPDGELAVAKAASQAGVPMVSFGLRNWNKLYSNLVGILLECAFSKMHLVHNLKSNLVHHRVQLLREIEMQNSLDLDKACTWVFDPNAWYQES